ncbi:MAG: hypothetical protein HQ453_13615 [Actinobacteria bacterium]|nr:hypothetical protein [Actinomycetota bacterium]
MYLKLKVLPPPPPPPPGQQRFTVNDIRLEGVDDQFDELRAAVRAAMKQDPGRVLNVEWWLQ